MGDIGTHRSIYESIKPILQTDANDDRAFYFELGNWFADVSQFNDPPAFYAAKRRAWEMAKEDTWESLLTIADIDEYLDALWGSEDSETRSAFGRWIEQLIFASGLEWVRLRSPEEMQRCTGMGMDPSKGVVEPMVYSALFSQFWTQYFPHEHLDFPFPGRPPRPVEPAKSGNKVDLSHLKIHSCREEEQSDPYDAFVSGKKRVQNRRVPLYLEQQVNFVAERFREVESLIAKFRETEQLMEQMGRHSNTVLLAHQHSPALEAQRNELYRQVLITLGRASHAIEDFFFHSNFVELARYGELCDRFRAAYSESPNDDWRAHTSYREIPDSALFTFPPFWRWLNTAEPEWTVRTKRTFCRRLLRFAGVGDQLKPDRDVPFSQYCYTGNFGANDVFHTFYDALIGMETRITPLLTVLSGGNSDDKNRIEPFEYIFLERKRRELSDPSVRTAALEVHWDRCDSGWYADQINRYVRAGCLHPQSGDALKEAIRIDTELRDAYKWAKEDIGDEAIDKASEEAKNAQGLGVMGFLYRLMDLVQSEHDASEEQRREFDQAEIVYDVVAENGASKENVSSHSLMAKDSKAEEGEQKLFRKDAILLGTFVAQYLTSLSMKQLRGEINHRIDWEHVLRHFIAHPAEAESLGKRDVWYRRALAGESPPVNEVLNFLKENEELIDYYRRKAVHHRNRANKSPWPHKRKLEAKYNEKRKAEHRAWKHLLAQ